MGIKSKLKRSEHPDGVQREVTFYGGKLLIDQINRVHEEWIKNKKL